MRRLFQSTAILYHGTEPCFPIPRSPLQPSSNERLMLIPCISCFSSSSANSKASLYASPRVHAIKQPIER